MFLMGIIGIMIMLYMTENFGIEKSVPCYDRQNNVIKDLNCTDRVYSLIGLDGDAFIVISITSIVLGLGMAAINSGALWGKKYD